RTGVPGLGRSSRLGRRGRAERYPSAEGSGRCGWGAHPPALPLPKLGVSLPSNNPDWGRPLPSVLGIPTLPAPHPPLHPLSSLGGREEADAGSSGRRRGSRLWSLGPGAPAPQLPGSRCSAPSCACACAGAVGYANRAGSGPTSSAAARRVAPRPARSRSRIGASCAAGGRPGLLEAAGGRDAGAKAQPTGARVGRAQGRRALFVWGAASSHACLAHPQIESAPAGRGGGAVTTSPHRLSEGNFRPQPRWPPGPAPPAPPPPPPPAPGLNPQGPAVPRRRARPTPWPAAVPAHLAGCPPGAKPPRVLRSPTTGPPLLRRGSHPAGEEAPSLISSSPELARGVVPPRRAVRGFHCGGRGSGTSRPGYPVHSEQGQQQQQSHPAQSMFQIPEFEPSEQEDSSPTDRGLGPSPTGDRPRGPGKHQRTTPGLLGEAGHQQGQPASSNHHGGAGAVETRSRHSSYPAGTEEDEGTEEEEPSPFRGRSRSAPPNLWAALRYGRELRRMSDEFQGSFKGLPRPKSAGTATQMRQSPSWTRFIQSWWDRNLGRGGSAPSQ
uniref:BCL2 associated agonist of cell death n=2 Tax=Felis catus TaxID=9685 RepID=A0ABI8ANX2_FELCA